ncbi:MAG: ABC-2 family transporter protein [Nitrospinae bacterium]|nr:ABC-2 family transporter protein [Nitrospinota bacterium]
MTAAMFLKFASVSFQRQIAYRFDYFVAVLNGFLYVFIFTSVWRVVFTKAGGEHGGFTTESIVTYAVIAMVIRISFSMDDTALPGKVRDGSVAVDLIRPMPFHAMNLAEAMGYSAFHFIARGIPILAVSALLFPVRIPADHLPLALVSLALAYLILFMLNFAVGLLAFWYIEIFPFMLLKYGLLNLLSGGIVPMDFFPAAVRPFLAFLPFQHIFYTPASIIIGHANGALAIEMVAEQAAWVAVMGAVCALAWRAGQNKLVIQGG